MLYILFIFKLIKQILTIIHYTIKNVCIYLLYLPAGIYRVKWNIFCRQYLWMFWSPLCPTHFILPGCSHVSTIFYLSCHCMQAYRVICMPSFTLAQTLNMQPSVSVSCRLSDSHCLFVWPFNVLLNQFIFRKCTFHCTQVSSTYTLPSSFMQLSVIYVDYNEDLLFLAVFDQNFISYLFSHTHSYHAADQTGCQTLHFNFLKIIQFRNCVCTACNFPKRNFSWKLFSAYII